MQYIPSYSERERSSGQTPGRGNLVVCNISRSAVKATCHHVFFVQDISSHFASTMTRNRAFGGVHTRCQASFSRLRFYTTSRLSNRMPTYQFNSLHYTTRGTRNPTLSSRLAPMMMDLSNTDISVIPRTRRQGPSTSMEFHDERRRTVNSLPSLIELKDDSTQLYTEYTKINKRIEKISRSIKTQEDHAASRRFTRSRGKTQSARQLQSALQQLDKTRAEYQVALSERERLQTLIKHKAEDIRDHPSRAASAAPQESSRTHNARRFSTPAPSRMTTKRTTTLRKAPNHW